MAQGQSPVEGGDALLEAMLRVDAMVNARRGEVDRGDDDDGDWDARDGSAREMPSKQRRPIAYMPEGGTTPIPFGALAPFKPTIFSIHA